MNDQSTLSIVDKDLYIASLPFSNASKNTSRIMLLVIFFCIPGIMVQIKYFGYGTLIQIILAIISAVLSESIILKLRKLPIIFHLSDNSAILTAILLAISIPPLAPWWVIIIGTIFSIIIAKQIYGGLGQNLFNPAMVGYVVLLISFPVQMTHWSLPNELSSIKFSFQDTLLSIFIENFNKNIGTDIINSISDIITQATPLDTFKTDLHSGYNIHKILKEPILTGTLAGVGWEWINVSFLIGGFLMIIYRLIYWQIPVSILITIIFCSSIAWGLDPNHQASPLIHLFSGATMLGAFFIATDPISAATTPYGRIIYGILIGMLIWLIRVYGGYSDGVAFAVLLANIAVPLIDHYTQPNVYGY
ncbi:Electron transport complex subunit RsxD [Serratia symbiotica]|nr:Electron transport complex subunit RsxD [Serratia symbiotica]